MPPTPRCVPAVSAKSTAVSGHLTPPGAGVWLTDRTCRRLWDVRHPAGSKRAGQIRRTAGLSTIEKQVFAWATGVDGSGGFRSVVVMADDRWIPQLWTGGLLRPGVELFRPAIPAAGPSGRAAGPSGRARMAPPGVAAVDAGQHYYQGDFADPAAELRFSDGTRLAQSRYGLAEFGWLETPTILRITDDDDFSAFLRDADVAKATGRFAAHTIHPRTVIADLAALGGRTERSGPSQRLFVSADGVVSTSPTGAPLGTATDSPAHLVARWHELNAESTRPCTVCLGLAVTERDRVDALAERPWMDRYVRLLGTLRKRSTGSLTAGDRWRSPEMPEFGE